MRKAFVGGLLLCLMTAFAVPLARAQDGSVVATGELYVRRTIFCLDGGELDESDPSACDDERTTVVSNSVEIEFPLDGSGSVTGSWELRVEYEFFYNGYRQGFCLHDSGGELTGTYDPSTRTIDGDPVGQDAMRAYGIDHATEECTREVQQPIFGDWEATFDGDAVAGTIWIDDGAGRTEAGGLGFHAPAEVTGEIGTIPDGDAGPSQEELDEYFRQNLEEVAADRDDFEDDSGGVPIAAVAGGAAVLGLGGVGAARMARARRRRTPSRERTADDIEPNDPCAEQRGRVQSSSTRAKGIQDSLQTLRALDAQLEDAWLNGREAGYWSATWDLASAGAGAVYGTLGIADDVAKSLGAVAVDAITKSLGESTTRDFLIWLRTERGPDVVDWVAGAGDDAGKDVVKDLFPEFLTNRVGGDPAFLTNVAKPVGESLSNLGGLIKLGSTISDASDVLAGIRAEQLRVTSHINNLEGRLSDAMNELDLARHALALCEKPAGAAAP